MTICIAIKCKIKKKEVILFASDRQQSSTFLKSSTVKIKDIYSIGKPEEQEDKTEEWGLLIASAGDAFLIDEVVNDIKFFLYDNIKWNEEIPSISLKIKRKEIGDIAYNVYKRHKDKELGNPIFELLIGACDKHSALLHVTCEGKTREIDNYAIIGSGRVTGGELLLAEFFKEDLTQKQAANLAALVISKVGLVDISVGGLPDIHMCRDRCTWVYKQEPFNKILDSSERRWALLKKAFWKMQSKDEIETKIRELVE